MEKENSVQTRIMLLENKIAENRRYSISRKQEEEENNIKVNKIVDKWLNLQKIIRRNNIKRNNKKSNRRKSKTIKKQL